MMFIEKDICVIIIPFDKVVADEIISKAHNYMRQIMLPQLLFEHYVKSNKHYVKSLKENVNIELVISDLNLEVSSVTEMEVELANERANQSYPSVVKMTKNAMKKLLRVVIFPALYLLSIKIVWSPQENDLVTI